MIVGYGNLPVPYPVVWSSEDEYWVARCPVVGRLAICQKESRGEGVPKFGQPNVMRQRRAICEGLCDLCGKPLKNATKILLANWRPLGTDEPVCPEPMLHAECARESLQHCPALRAQVRQGTLRVLRVSRWDALIPPTDTENVHRFVPGWSGGPVVGLAGIKVLASKDITQQWGAA